MTPRKPTQVARLSPAQIRALRHALGESRATFAARFCASRRSIEAWEQGHKTPHAFILQALTALQKKIEKDVDFP